MLDRELPSNFYDVWYPSRSVAVAKKLKWMYRETSNLGKNIIRKVKGKLHKEKHRNPKS